jgi:stage V sporulation protein D (sporulation-specific penicillin-binding protein)
MEGVIERGTGKSARMHDFRAGGKTGTAQKVSPKGGYYKNKYIASFVGFAPYENPEIVLLISVDDPKGKYFGGQIGAPAFKNIMEKVLSYMEIKNDKHETKKNS